MNRGFLSLIICFLGYVTFILISGCTNQKQASVPNTDSNEPVVGMRRDQLALMDDVIMTQGAVRNGYSTENIQYNGILYVATYELRGDGWNNPQDLLVDMVPLSEALEK